MTSTLAPSPWTATRGPRGRGGAWTLGRETGPVRDGDSPAELQWRFVRCESFARCHLLAAFGLLGAVSLGFGVAFWQAGAPGVLPFAGVEVLLVGLAFWVASRHAGDGETITLAQHELRVEQRRGRRVDRVAFRAEWVRVEPRHGEGSLVELSGQGRQAQVGRYLRPELRATLARELRAALRREGARAAAPNTQSGQQR